jgi:ABC-type dipeptide/oligopeptide/nickel transport system permease component
MLRFVLSRLALAVPTLLCICALVFFSAYLAPGDPADVILGEKSAPEAKARLREELGLNRPPLERFGSYVTGIVTRGDLGTSYQPSREPVKEIIARGFPNTALLAGLALLTSLLVGVPLGILAAVWANKLPDRLSMALALIGVALPSFVLGPALVLLLAVRLPWLPVIGFSLQSGLVQPQFFVLPVLVLAARSAALIARLTRSAMLDVLSQDYVRTARAKGLSTATVLFKHALKNALPPILTVTGTTFGYLLSGSFVVETFFTIPGIGNESIASILRRDYPVIQGLALLMASGFVLINLIVDILYGVIDPRARVGGGPTRKASV